MDTMTIFAWMNEIAAETPEQFEEFFFNDIRSTLFPNWHNNNPQPDESIAATGMFCSLLQCTSKIELRQSMARIAGHVVTNMDVRASIFELFGAQPLKANIVFNDYFIAVNYSLTTLGHRNMFSEEIEFVAAGESQMLSPVQCAERLIRQRLLSA